MVDFMKNSGSSVIKEKTLGGGEGGSLDMETSDCRGDKGGLVVQQEQQVVVDVEEGEISSDSCEEISEEAFKTKPPSPTLPPPLRRRVSGGSTGAAASVVVNVSSNASGNNPVSGGGGGKLWTMKDVYSNFRIAPKTSYSGLYNLAWAQAVNNKPLDEVFVMMEDTSAKENNSGGNDNSRDKNLDENKAVTDEGDKEDGELEEGEIDLDSDSVVGNENSGMGIKSEMMRGDGSRREVERRKRVDSIKKSLESLTFADAGKSFDGLCASFKKSVENLQKMMPEGSFAEKDDLVQLLLNAIRNLHSALSSMTPGSKERDRSIFLRLLTHVTSLKPSPFTSLQLKELEVILSSVDSLTNDGIDRNKQSSGSLKKTDWGTLSDNPNKESARKREIESRSTASFGETENSISLDHSKPGSTVNSKQNKGLALPLLDLHKDHDADSLPSPTRELSAPLPFDKGFVLGQGLVKPEWPVPRRTIDRESYLLHPYETDAVKAVSSYQQKFGRTSIFMSDKLPSPTPSEEGDDTGDVEMSGEVSSSIVKQNVSSATVNPSSLGSFMNTSILSQPVVYSTSVTNMLVGQQFNGPRILGSVSANTNPMLKPSSAKSRDPRLRLANSDVGGSRNLKQNISSAVAKESKQDSLVFMSSRKQKTVEELVLDGPVSKRQRNEPTSSVYDVQAVTGTGGWLEDRGPVGIGVTNGNSSHIGSQSTTLPTTSANTSLPVISTQTSLLTNPITTVPVTGPYTLPSTGQNAKKPVVDSNTTVIDSLLRDIAVNPSIWMNILKMEHQKSSDNSKSMSQPPSVNSIQGAVPSTNASLPSSSVLGQISAGTDQIPTHAVSVEESGKIRMKPRDPRRLLYNNNAPEKGGAMGSDRPKVNESLMAGNNLSKQEDNSDKKSVLSSTTTMRPPDIGRQFTTTLRSIADMLSVSSQVSVPSPASRPQIPSSSQQPVQGHHQVESGNQRNGSSSLASEEANGVPPRPLNANAWSDVEHLFDGFDDQQKVAIHRERSRRLDEQKKLFAARKLCLVLDLDHTLLNSAKFVEVDSLHNELLLKKEEQDREKPYRHLFRFPHMGMWTKLRPGIWNFLEKASKLFELHLYTMGNKYYATEMAKLLDPKGELFAGRVISRGDDGEPFDGDDRVVVPKSKDLEGVLGMESGVVIIDDSVRVWPHNKLNLIVVERYIYFPCSRRQFGLPGPSLLEIDHDERPEDGTLASSLAVIERIHQIFFAHQSLDAADVRNILACEQRKILSGCRIVFSRVFPVGEAKPHMHPLWQTAEQFGAVCTNQIDDQVTHVVANSLGTDKVNWAVSKGKFVVHPGWVEASALLYRRANEHDFAIKQP